MSMICVPVVAETVEEAIADINIARTIGADAVELRLDYLPSGTDVEHLVEQCRGMVVVATNRPVREGGKSEETDSQRLELLRRASDAGADYVDIEHDVYSSLGFDGSAKVIASHHNFDETPANLNDIVQSMEQLPCDVVKFATMARSLEDNLRLWEAMAECKKPVIGLCMGELGEVSRVLAIRFGSLLTFGSIGAGKESAPGQLTAADLIHLYRAKSITAETALYCVVGNPIAHSVSPEIHNSAFRELDMDAAYLRFRVAELAPFLKSFEMLNLQGISVTIPHKQAALEASTKVDAVAQRIGAVNTLARAEDGSWQGDNTDWQAAVGAIADAADRSGLALRGARALLLGAGGAARGIAFGLKEAGCKLVIANRTVEKARTLAREVAAETAPLDDVGNQEFEVVANSTSVGMHPHEDASPVDGAVFRPGMVAFDAVYNPRETRMLREAREAGAEIADGVAMFVRQAARQFEIWTSSAPPLEVMERIVVQRLGGGDKTGTDSD